MKNLLTELQRVTQWTICQNQGTWAGRQQGRSAAGHTVPANLGLGLLGDLMSWFA